MSTEIHIVRKKFNLSRYFSLFSVSIIIALTVIMSYLVYSNQKSALLDYSLSHSESLALNLNKRLYDKFIVPSLNEHEYLLAQKDSQRILDLEEIVNKYLQEYEEIVKCKIFNQKREVVYSTDHDDTGKISNTEAIRKVLSGEISWKLNERDIPFPKESSQAGKVFDVDLLELYVPVYNDTGHLESHEIIGAFEIYQNVSPLFNLMKEEFYKIPLLLVFSMSLLYLMLQTVVNKAARIIADQRKEIELYNSELEEAQHKITESIDEVIEHESFHVRFVNDNLVKCWEVKNCDNSTCPSYNSSDVRCWQVAGTFCGGAVQGVFANKYGDCRKCEVFTHAFSNRINTIGESFNNMMALLQAKHLELQEANKKLNVLVEIDPLTEVGNRRSFQSRIEHIHLLSLRYNRPYSIIICDVDNFKLYNDTYGHQQGDYALISVSNVMKSSIRRTDEIFRWGGEEFIVILPELSHAEALKVAENLRAAVQQLKLKHEKSDLHVVTLSCGVASFYPWKTGDIGWEYVVKQADEALYRAKTGKKNSVYSASIG